MHGLVTFLHIAESSTESVISGDWVQDSSVSSAKESMNTPDVTVGTKGIAIGGGLAPSFGGRKKHFAAQNNDLF